MEKITINSIEHGLTRQNKPFLKVVFNGDRKASIFGEQDVFFVQNHIKAGHTIECDLEPKGNYLNIKNIKMDIPTGEPISQAPISQGSLMPQRDASIVAQVCLKGAVELAKDRTFENNEDLGQYLCMAVGELAGAYKVAIKNLE